MEEEIINLAKSEIIILQKNMDGNNHLKTNDIRKLSSKLFKKLQKKDIESVLELCETMLKEESWELGVIAYDFARRMAKDYTLDTYEVFYSWLKKYVRGWGDCDDFCTHAFGQLLIKYKEIFTYILKWTEDDDFWVRRASAVVLIPAISKNDYEGIRALEIADKLLEDEHDLVRKGYGWMLKILATVDEEKVVEYLEKNYAVMPRVSFRYALEKVDTEKRKYLMSLS